MEAFKNLRNFIMPLEVNFFQRLQDQSIIVKNIIDELYKIYITQESSSHNLLIKMIQEAEDARVKKLKELYQVFITPVDKEAISRAYINLDWVVMSIKHLEIELEIYEITNLKEYNAIFNLLKSEINDLKLGFGMLNKNEITKFSQNTFNIVHSDNELIREYAQKVSTLLNISDFKFILSRKEILMQLKEISKRIRICANDLEDMSFKMI